MKCKYCKSEFKDKKWLREDEKGVCFTCRWITQHLGGVLHMSRHSSNKKSRSHWADKLNSIL